MFKYFVTVKSMLDKIMEIAKANPNKEVCGLITGTDVDKKIVIGEKLFQIENISPDLIKAVDYTMNPVQMLKVLKTTSLMNKSSSDDFVCIWHSHPNGLPNPSSIDLARVSYNVVYIIYGVLSDECKAWTYNKNENKFEQTTIFLTDAPVNKNPEFKVLEK